jgi:transcriptional regulator with XRE-family HTH domain
MNCQHPWFARAREFLALPCYAVSMNLDFNLRGTTLRKGFDSCLLHSRWPKRARDKMRSAGSACQVLRRIRTHYRLSQAEVAALLGTTAATVQAWEAGRRKPSGPARMLIILVEQALEHWPPGKWRQIWEYPLTFIIAARKGENHTESEDEFWSKFECYSPKEKNAVILKWETDLRRMKMLMERERLVKKEKDAPSELERGAEVEKMDELQCETEAGLKYGQIQRPAR